MNIFMLHRTVRNQMISTNESDAPVIAKDESGKLFTLKALKYEPQSTDEDGNATSTGSTFFLEIEEL